MPACVFPAGPAAFRSDQVVRICPPFYAVMRTRLTLKPGQRGTRKLVAKYGDRLVCVRYRYDEERKKRYKTVELIVEEADWEPRDGRIAGDAIVGIRVDYQELELRRKVKRAGGRWNPERRGWEVRYDRVVEMGLEERVVEVFTRDRS